jgi:5-methylcytosine-specific restriction endonuclease McrA
MAGHARGSSTCSPRWTARCAGASWSVPIGRAEIERIACDYVQIGDLQSNELTKPRSAIPAAIRRKVWMRDMGTCVVPGCRSCRYIEAHHLEWLSFGGVHSVENIALLCAAHHKQLHDGLISIAGRAPDLVFDMAEPSWD